MDHVQEIREALAEARKHDLAGRHHEAHAWEDGVARLIIHLVRREHPDVREMAQAFVDFYNEDVNRKRGYAGVHNRYEEE